MEDPGSVRSVHGRQTATLVPADPMLCGLCEHLHAGIAHKLMQGHTSIHINKQIFFKKNSKKKY